VADVSARLASHDVVVCATTLLATDPQLAHALQVLSERERGRYHAYTNEVVGRRFVVGRALLREVVGCAIGTSPDQVPLGEGVHGKPALCGRAQPRPLWFSVAHCDDLILIALSGTSEVGVDLERARSIEQWERVADRVLAPSERTQLRLAVERGEDAGNAFLRHWCRVEAELKAIGCGIAGLEDHVAGRRPLGLRVLDLDRLPWPAPAVPGVHYQAALALCAPGLESARHTALAASQAATPTANPARASTA
jgi:4'-phosphopantetheinyl transferase